MHRGILTLEDKELTPAEMRKANTDGSWQWSIRIPDYYVTLTTEFLFTKQEATRHARETAKLFQIDLDHDYYCMECNECSPVEYDVVRHASSGEETRKAKRLCERCLPLAIGHGTYSIRRLRKRESKNE